MSGLDTGPRAGVLQQRPDRGRTSRRLGPQLRQAAEVGVRQAPGCGVLQEVREHLRLTGDPPMSPRRVLCAVPSSSAVRHQGAAVVARWLGAAADEAFEDGRRGRRRRADAAENVADPADVAGGERRHELWHRLAHGGAPRGQRPEDRTQALAVGRADEHATIFGRNASARPTSGCRTSPRDVMWKNGRRSLDSSHRCTGARTPGWPRRARASAACPATRSNELLAATTSAGTADVMSCVESADTSRASTMAASPLEP